MRHAAAADRFFVNDVALVTLGLIAPRYMVGAVIDRRTLLLGGAAAALNPVPGWADCVWPPPGWAEKGFPTRRWVKVTFVHTGERFKDLYMDDGKYIVGATGTYRT